MVIMADTDFALSIVGLLVSLGGFTITYIKYVRENEKRITAIEEKCGKLTGIEGKLDDLILGEKDKGERIKALEVKTELFWQAVQKSVINLLKHPTEKRRDILMDKLGNQTATIDELKELRVLIACEERIKKEEVLAAGLLIARIDALLYNLEVRVVLEKKV